MNTPLTIEDLMTQALAMEREAVARYQELADIMETHNNTEVAALFRQMAGYEQHHVDHILTNMGWAPDVVTPLNGGMWTTPEAPESVAFEDVHYLMHPWHALKLALAAERRAQAFFEQMLAGAVNEAVRAAAIEMRDEEAEHVTLIEGWLAKVPKPDDDWAEDPDPPRYID